MTSSSLRLGEVRSGTRFNVNVRQASPGADLTFPDGRRFVRGDDGWMEIRLDNDDIDKDGEQ